MSKKTMDTVIKKPKEIRQYTRHRCWAAALVSWMEVTSGNNTKQEQLIKQFGLPNGGLDYLSGLPKIANFAYMKVEKFDQENFKVDEIKKRLNQKGHLYIVYKVDSTWSHAVVLYGVKESTDAPKYMVMDPFSGYKERFQADFFSKEIYVALGYRTAIPIPGILPVNYLEF